MDTVKPWYESRLLWLGVITVLLAAGDALLSGGTWRNIGVAVIGALVAYIRLNTDQILS